MNYERRTDDEKQKKLLNGFFRIYLAVLVWLASCLLPGTALADDEGVYYGEPYFSVLAPGGSLQAVSVHIRLDGNIMTVQYLLNNTLKKNVSATIAFEMPAYGWAGAGNVYPDRSYADLSMFIDAHHVSYARYSKADCNGRDVTGILRQYGVHPNDVGNMDMWTFDMTPEKEAYYAPLKQQDIVDDNGMPEWETTNRYTYAVSIAPESSLRVEYRYTIQPGYYYFSKQDQQIRAKLKDFGFSRDSIPDIYGPDGGSKEHYYLTQWMDLPVWPRDWADGIDVHITLLPGKTCGFIPMIGIKTGKRIVFKKGTLSMPLSKAKNPIQVIMFNPM